VASVPAAVLIAKLGASVVVVGLLLHFGHGPVPAVTTAAHGTAHGGTYRCAALEQLWESAGGPRGEAFTAAEIAMAESDGETSAMNYTDNGGTQTSVGIWQLSTGTHDYPAAWTTPAGNAAGAVAKYDGAHDSFTPWGTYDTGIYAGRC
jgi:hypothetical protein